MHSELDANDYYRLPWTLNDNVLGWLEPTKRCNLYCEGCYSRNERNSDKSLEQIRAELDVFARNRRLDSISVTGGDPLVHPRIVEIVRIIRHEYGFKPVLNTNCHTSAECRSDASRRSSTSFSVSGRRSVCGRSGSILTALMGFELITSWATAQFSRMDKDRCRLLMFLADNPAFAASFWYLRIRAGVRCETFRQSLSHAGWSPTPSNRARKYSR